MVLSPLLFVKVLVARYYKNHYSLLMPIGLVIFVLSFVLIGITAGPTLAQTLRLLQESFLPAPGGPDAAAYTAYALALQSAYRQRLTEMGDADGRRALGADDGDIDLVAFLPHER